MEVARSRVGYRQMLLCFSAYSLCSLCLLFFSPVTVIPYCRLCNVFVCIIFFILMKNVPRGTVEKKGVIFHNFITYSTWIFVELDVLSPVMFI